MVGTILETRMANALFANAKMSQRALDTIGEFAEPLGAGAKLGLASAQTTLDAFARIYGGLWVGGRAILTEESFTFEPNALNRAIHENGESLRLDLPLGAIDAVTTRFGWFTGIIDIDSRGSVFSLRCYGSKRFAANIEIARGTLQS